ncbi:SRPBCC family protein [Candidatus Saccharibacteria bacterium]|nr:MAG: SRPBCC family protein [Candidatus Saccharibacteria bacterium]
MNKIHLKASWIVNAPRESLYKITTDFENMPKNFPKVAHSVKIVKREGNNLLIHAEAKSLGIPPIPVTMQTTLVPGKGYISENTNHTFNATGHEEFLMKDAKEGTKITYSYEYDLSKSNIMLRVIAKPLFGWVSMWYWKRVYIDRLVELTHKRDINL